MLTKLGHVPDLGNALNYELWHALGLGRLNLLIKHASTVLASHKASQQIHVLYMKSHNFLWFRSTRTKENARTKNCPITAFLLLHEIVFFPINEWLAIRCIRYA